MKVGSRLVLVPFRSLPRKQTSCSLHCFGFFRCSFPSVHVICSGNCTFAHNDHTGLLIIIIFYLIFIVIPLLFLNSCTEHQEKSNFPLGINKIFWFWFWYIAIWQQHLCPFTCLTIEHTRITVVNQGMSRKLLQMAEKAAKNSSKNKIGILTRVYSE